MMKGNDAVEIVVCALQSVGVPFMVVGSYSSNYYGIPRATKDADLVVEFAPQHLGLLVAALPEEIGLDPQMSFETVTGTARHVLLVRGTSFKIELFLLSDDPHDQARFGRRIVQQPWPGFTAALPTPEDVVIQKLRWAKSGRRSKDFDDAVAVLAVQDQALNFSYIESWCAVHENLALLAEARAAARLG